MTTMKNWMTCAPRPSRVSIRFLSSTALSSWAVPSVASRSSRALTIPCTNRLASRIATIVDDDDEDDRDEGLAGERRDVAPAAAR